MTYSSSTLTTVLLESLTELPLLNSSSTNIILDTPFGNEGNENFTEEYFSPEVKQFLSKSNIVKIKGNSYNVFKLISLGITARKYCFYEVLTCEDFLKIYQISDSDVNEITIQWISTEIRNIPDDVFISNKVKYDFKYGLPCADLIKSICRHARDISVRDDDIEHGLSDALINSLCLPDCSVTTFETTCCDEKIMDVVKNNMSIQSIRFCIRDSHSYIKDLEYTNIKRITVITEETDEEYLVDITPVLCNDSIEYFRITTKITYDMEVADDNCSLKYVNSDPCDELTILQDMITKKQNDLLFKCMKRANPMW
jgi:hypothetical protein